MRLESGQLARKAADELDVLIAPFQGNSRIPSGLVLRIFSPSEIDDLEKMGLVVVENASVFCPMNLFPCMGLYAVTDRCELNPGINQVMWLHSESFLLAHLVDREMTVDSTLDLCTGSGIHALLASRHSRKVVGVDFSERAIAFSTFNRKLTDIVSVEFRQGDLYDPVERGCFDMVLANPPYNPSSSPPSSNCFGGGPSGEDVLSRVIRGISSHLSRGGVCLVVSLLLHQHECDYREKICRWLGEPIFNDDILIRSVDIHHSASPCWRPQAWIKAISQEWSSV